MTDTHNAERFKSALWNLTEVAKTHRVSRHVEVNIDAFLAEFKRDQEINANIDDDAFLEANPNLADDIHLLRKVKSMLAALKPVFTVALEQAVYGNGGRVKADLAPSNQRTSWQEQLKTGPIDLDKRLEAARMQVEEKLKAMGLTEPFFMNVYDGISGAVKAEVGAELASFQRR